MPNEPVMEVTIKHMINPTGKTKSDTIFITMATHLLIVTRILRKNMITTTDPNLAKKPKLILKTDQIYEEVQ